MPYGNRDLGQYCFRQRLFAWRHQAITWTNVYLSLRSSDVHLRAISLEISQQSVTKISLKNYFSMILLKVTIGLNIINYFFNNFDLLNLNFSKVYEVRWLCLGEAVKAAIINYQPLIGTPSGRRCWRWPCSHWATAAAQVIQVCCSSASDDRYLGRHRSSEPALPVQSLLIPKH